MRAEPRWILTNESGAHWVQVDAHPASWEGLETIVREFGAANSHLATKAAIHTPTNLLMYSIGLKF